MKSNFELLTPRQQHACFAAGYNPLYGDYPTVEEAKRCIENLPANCRQIDVVGAVKAVVNTCILTTVMEETI
jgi:hypothetical protein